jgi:hypothetical protein
MLVPIAQEERVTNDQAKDLSEMLRTMAAQLDGWLQGLRGKEPEDSFKKYAKGIGQVLGAMYLDVLKPLYDEHPELTPPSLR